MPASLIASTWPLLLGMGILMLGAGLHSTLLGVRAQAEGFTTSAIGIVMSCYYIGFLVVTPILWGVTRLVTGICLAGIYVVAESWLNDRATQETRSRILALYMVVLYGGLGAAQFLLLVSDPGTDTPFMLVAALSCLAIVPLVLSAQSVPAVDTPRSVRFRDLYRRSPLGVFAVLMSGLMASIVFSLGPVYARLKGMDDAAIATFMAGSILAGVLTQYPIGMLADRLERRAVIAGVAALAAGLGLWLALAPELPDAVLLTVAALISGLVLSVYSLGVSHVNDRLETSEMVAASSALLLLNGAAAVIGPIVGGVLMDRQGAPAYFATLAAIAALLAVFCLWRRSRRAPVPREQRGPYIKAQPETTAVTEESQWRDPSVTASSAKAG
ncbi:MAG: MFS transporter [Proteobacteria bacterium]|nr:MFS transporter [Pseudomonadota bacterium]